MRNRKIQTFTKGNYSVDTFPMSLGIPMEKHLTYCFRLKIAHNIKLPPNFSKIAYK